MKVLKFGDWLVESQSQSDSSENKIPDASGDIINSLVERLKKHEGVRDKVYNDSAGIPTIGVGFNLNRPDAPEKIKKLGLDYNSVKSGKKTLTPQQIDSLLKQDIKSSWNSAKDIVENFVSLPSNAKSVIVEMIFNLGRSGFLKFKNFKNMIEQNDFIKASQEMLRSNWAKQVGERAKNLSNLLRNI